MPGDKNSSDAPSKNHGRCNDYNINQIFPDDNINELYNATTYNLGISNELNPGQILTVYEDNDAPKILYDSDGSNYDHDTYQGTTDNKDNDTPQRW